ncbi:ABC transporter substrate-binding protein [Salinispira pacifica]
MLKVLRAVAIVALLVAAAGVAFAGGSSEQKTQKTPVIGISKIVSHPALDAVEKGIQDQLKEMNINVQYDLQNANGDVNTAKQIANKFKSEGVAVAVGIATPTAIALAETMKDIPVVFSAVTDPVAAGLVPSLNQGGKNVTGYSDMTPVKSQIELMAKFMNLKRLGHVYSSSEPNAVVLADLAKKACQELGIQFVPATVTNSAEVRQATQSIVGRVDAIYVSTDNTVVSALPSLTEVAMQAKVPVISADPSSAESYDVLAAYGFDYYTMGRATGKLIAQILGGKSPSQIPTQFLTDRKDLILLVNLDVAKKMGINLPQSVINDANKIVENGKVRSK